MSKRFLASVLGLLVLLLAVSVATAAADTPPGVQTAGQGATSGQQAAAASGATQIQPSNTNISVRVLSPGNGGNVTQANTVSSTGNASNSNSTNQSATQNQTGPGGIQTSTQSAANSQLAAALSFANQVAPTNTNLVIRVGSSGNDGSVSQANNASSDASSKNYNDTQQTADQSQVGGSPCGCATSTAPIQTSDQSAGSDQKALALSGATQRDASNVNLPIRVGSSGNDGNVAQSNTVSSDAKAKNDNDLRQSSGQTNAGSGTGVQTANQSAGNDQAAAAASSAKQDKPQNTNISVRVLSPGDDGNVSQSNSVSSDAKAKNDNGTSQKVDQGQTGSKSPCGCASTPAIQTATQAAGSEQAALSLSKAEQTGASNANAPIRVGSTGNGGDVRQSNDVSSKAKAKNDNGLDQSATQNAAGGSGTGVQTADQRAGNAQLAADASLAEQHGASNSNAPIRVGSSGDGGTVAQSNDVSSKAKAKNDNDAHQNVDQNLATGGSCGCAGSGVQTATQAAGNKQAALALSKADQDFGKSECGCHAGGNSNAPVRVGSTGNDGGVWQSNDVSSKAKAKNDNGLDQSATQHAAGGSGTGVQTADQRAGNAQLAADASLAKQHGASNSNAPIRVGSSGDGGRVGQSNDVSSKATAKNDNDTHQRIDQDPSAHEPIRTTVPPVGHECGCSDPIRTTVPPDGHDCGCSAPTGVQTAKQAAGNAQAAFSLSKADQSGAKNDSAPVRVGSAGNDGSVRQSNDVSSKAKAKNDNDLDQSVGQHLSGPSGTGIQTADQSAGNAQLAAGASFAEQKGASNKNAPVRVGSSGNGGTVAQSNNVSSDAKAKNDNHTNQHADQDLSGRLKCGCDSSIGIQALAQKAENRQGALALSKAVQDFGRSECGCQAGGNSNTPTRVWSSGDDGSVAQSNSVDSKAKAKNRNSTDQTGHQAAAGAAGIGIQALGQEASNWQADAALSAAFQLGASNHNKPVRVHSSGNEGSVQQDNADSSKAKAKNWNHAKQDGSQVLSGLGCGCNPINVQALGQSAKNGQTGLGLSGADQLAPSNASGGDSVYSTGYGGALGQFNDDNSFAAPLNRDRAEMLAGQNRS